VNPGDAAARRRSERYFAHPDRAVWAGTGLIAVVLLMAVLVPAGPLSIDRAWSEAMQDHQRPLLKDLALVFNALGRGIGLAVSLAVIAVVLLRARRWLALVAFAIVEGLAPLSSALLKALTDRARPPDGVVQPHGTSFPSGHTTYAGATCVALVLLFTTPGPRRGWWWTLAVLGIIGMAWSRTYLQVHWLSHVIGGALLGIGISLLVFGAAQQCGAHSNPLSTGRRRARGKRAPSPPPSQAGTVAGSRPKSTSASESSQPAV
jgi:membrane-associated phospholipid phosphatase